MRLNRSIAWLPTLPAIAIVCAPAFGQFPRSGGPLVDPPPNVPIVVPSATFVFIYPHPPLVRPYASFRPLTARPIRRDAREAERLTIIGDRFFRRKNYPRATERYERACEADPLAADPRIGLALIALERDDYVEAAGRFREVQAADPEWLARRPRDIEGVYASPSRFADAIAKLETRVQTHPEDRDAWILLGAHWYLSGRWERGSDIFLRLDDGRSDRVVDAFLDAIDLKRLENQKRAEADRK